MPQRPGLGRAEPSNQARQSAGRAVVAPRLARTRSLAQGVAGGAAAGVGELAGGAGLDQGSQARLAGFQFERAPQRLFVAQALGAARRRLAVRSLL
jgi:hypothetical protein